MNNKARRKVYSILLAFVSNWSYQHLFTGRKYIRKGIAVHGQPGRMVTIMLVLFTIMMVLFTIMLVLVTNMLVLVIIMLVLIMHAC